MELSANITRDAPIDRPVIGMVRFLSWPARIGDRPVSLTSCRFRADPIIASGAGRDVTATCTLTVYITVASIHVVSHENYSNFNGIHCKRRLIMCLFRARWSLNSLSECVRETAHTSNSQKCTGAYCGRKKKYLQNMILVSNIRRPWCFPE